MHSCINWKIITDDFGDSVSVSEIYWPCAKYHSIIVQRYHHWK